MVMSSPTYTSRRQPSAGLRLRRVPPVRRFPFRSSRTAHRNSPRLHWVAPPALATRLLARDDASVLAVLGAGVQARAHIEAIPRVRPVGEIRIASRTYAHAAALADDVGAKAVGSFLEAVRGADVICACTDSPIDLSRAAHPPETCLSQSPRSSPARADRP